MMYQIVRFGLSVFWFESISGQPMFALMSLSCKKKKDCKKL